MSKTRQILEYIRDNSPAKATDICKAVLERRDMQDKYTGRKYFYYPGWSGYRVYLTQWGYYGDKAKAKIRLTEQGYVLTAYGRQSLK